MAGQTGDTTDHTFAPLDLTAPRVAAGKNTSNFANLCVPQVMRASPLV